MFSPKGFALIVVLFLVAFLLVTNCLAEGWQTRSGTSEAADSGKIAPGYYYNTTYDTYFRNQTYFTVGNIKLSWWPTGNDRFGISLRTSGQAPLEFCLLPKGITLNKVKNPEALPFIKAGDSRTVFQKLKTINGKQVVVGKPSNKPLTGSHIAFGVTWGGPVNVDLGIGQAVIFKLGDEYSGLQAFEMEKRVWSGRDYEAYKGSKTDGGILKFSQMTWTWSAFDDETLAQARRTQNK